MNQKKMTNRISELLDPTQEQTERMLRNILAAGNEEHTEKAGVQPIRRLRPGLVAALIILSLITTTAFATAYFKLDMKFFDFLNPSSDEQKAYLDAGAYVIDQQIVDETGTLDIKQVIGDSNLTYILLDFTAPEGTVLNSMRYRFRRSNLDFDQAAHGIHYTLLDDDDENDNKISLMMAIMTPESLVNQEIDLTLENFEGADTATSDFYTVASGEWKATLNFNFTEYATEREINQDITMFGYPARVTTIAVSPISVTLKLDSSFFQEIDEAAVAWYKLKQDKELDPYPVTIQYKDGTSHTTTVRTGKTSIQYYWGHMLTIKTFDTIINDREITSITFFDTVIPITS